MDSPSQCFLITIKHTHTYNIYNNERGEISFVFTGDVDLSDTFIGVPWFVGSTFYCQCVLTVGPVVPWT